jgi:hypothetical protein
MTKFDKAGFNFDGMYLMYEGNFIARFKRGGMGDFKRFLVKNFSVEEYLKLVNEFNMAPITALETKGYVSLMMKKVLIKMGYEPSAGGKVAYLNDAFAGKL